MTVEGLANNYTTTLAAAITSTGATSISLTDNPPATLSATQFRLLIDNELMLCTSFTGSGPTVATVTRAIENTVAATHTNTTAVEQIVTRGSVQNFANSGYYTWYTASGISSSDTAAVRYGASATGPPISSGTYAVGDVIPLQTGQVGICATAGSPGTWKYLGTGKWSCSAHFTGSPTVANNAESVVIGWEATEWDYNGNFTVGAQGGSSSGHYTAPVTGVYEVVSNLDFGTSAGSSTTYGTLCIYVNPTFSGNTMTAGITRRGLAVSLPAAGRFGAMVYARVSLVTNDKVYIGLFQASGASATGFSAWSSGQPANVFQVNYVGPSF